MFWKKNNKRKKEFGIEQYKYIIEVKKKVESLGLPIESSTDMRTANFVLIGHLLERIEDLEKEIKDLRDKGLGIST